MQGIVFDFKRFSVHDGPGIRTTVFLKGCPLSCWWCHNPESQQLKSEKAARKYLIEGIPHCETETIGKLLSPKAVCGQLAKDQIYYDESGGGITISGGEPLMQHAFTTELLEACKAEGFHTALDTTGYATPEVFGKIIDLPDLFLFDLKLMDNALHRKYTGVSNLPILRNLEALSVKKKRVIIRFPVIPGITDTPQNIAAIKAIMHRFNFTEIALLPYHSIANHKYEKFGMENKMQGISALSAPDIFPLKAEMEAEGFKVKIGG